MAREGTERTVVLPNYGVPDASVSFSFNPLVLEAAAADDRIRCGLWVSPRPQDAEMTDTALALAGEQGVVALKTSFLLGGRADDPDCEPQLEKIFQTARTHGLVVHIHTSPGAALGHRPGRHARRQVRRRGQDPPRPPRWRRQRAHQAHRQQVLRLDRGRQAGLHRHQLGRRVRSALAGAGDRAPWHRPGPGAVRQRRAVGRPRRRAGADAAPRPGTASSAAWSCARTSPASTAAEPGSLLDRRSPAVPQAAVGWRCAQSLRQRIDTGHGASATATTPSLNAVIRSR